MNLVEIISQALLKVRGYKVMPFFLVFHSHVMSEIFDKYASNLKFFKLSEFLSHENHFTLRMNYSILVNWKSLEQFWCSVCEGYAVGNQKKIIYTKGHLEIEYKRSKTVEKYAKSLLKTTPNLKKLIKEERSRTHVSSVASSDRPANRKDMETMVNIAKLFFQVTNSGERYSWLKEEMTEAEYTTRFITPLINLTLKSYSTKMVFKPGEQKLLLVKNYENSALIEDDAHLPGPNIDGIIKSMNLDVSFFLVEVSGSPNNSTDNCNHYKGDRSKLVNNLKYLCKVVISMKSMPSFKPACKIKLFGIHIYYDQVCIYSL